MDFALEETSCKDVLRNIQKSGDIYDIHAIISRPFEIAVRWYQNYENPISIVNFNLIDAYPESAQREPYHFIVDEEILISLKQCKVTVIFFFKNVNKS